MVANNHICCICHESRKQVVIHHIDSNPRNHAPANLATVCHDCHSRITGDEGLGRRFTPTEVTLFKQRWEAVCAGEGETVDELDEPEQLVYQVTRVEGNTNLPFEFPLEKGDELLVSISADDYFDVSICTPADYQRWFKAPDDFREYDGATDVIECELSFIAPRKGTYLLVLINGGDDDLEAVIDASVWSDIE